MAVVFYQSCTLAIYFGLSHLLFAYTNNCLRAMPFPTGFILIVLLLWLHELSNLKSNETWSMFIYEFERGRRSEAVFARYTNLVL